MENTDIALTERGGIQVNKHLETSVPGVFAVGDVNGGLQFTYISLDDFRIVFNYLTGDGSYNLETRGAVPTAMFLNPPLAQVGLTEDQARAADRLLSRNFQLLACLVVMLTVICVVPSKLW